VDYYGYIALATLSLQKPCRKQKGKQENEFLICLFVRRKGVRRKGDRK
jgi:hypothetical protein